MNFKNYKRVVQKEVSYLDSDFSIFIFNILCCSSNKKEYKSRLNIEKSAAKIYPNLYSYGFIDEVNKELEKIERL